MAFVLEEIAIEWQQMSLVGQVARRQKSGRAHCWFARHTCRILIKEQMGAVEARQHGIKIVQENQSRCTQAARTFFSVWRHKLIGRDRTLSQRLILGLGNQQHRADNSDA